MASVIISGDTSGTATLQAQAVAGNTVLTLPTTSGNVVVDTATQTLTNKTITSPTITTPTITTPVINSATFNPSGSAPVFAARAWVNFDGTRDSSGATTAAFTNRFIYASGNVTSVLKTATGTYTITFTTAMPSANYAVVTTGTATASVYTTSGPVEATLAAGSFQMKQGSGDTGAESDRTYNSAVVFA
jgi:hypothetical protein